MILTMDSGQFSLYLAIRGVLCFSLPLLVVYSCTENEILDPDLEEQAPRLVLAAPTPVSFQYSGHWSPRRAWDSINLI